MRGRRTELQSRRDDLMVAQQARNERRPGLRAHNDFLFFSFWFGAPLARQTRRKKRGSVRGAADPGSPTNKTVNFDNQTSRLAYLQHRQGLQDASAAQTSLQRRMLDQK